MIEFYNATGGDYWTSYTVSNALRDEIASFDEYVVELGALAAMYPLADLSTEYQEVITAVEELSVNCSLQRTLNTVNLLVKYPWNTDSECLLSEW